MITTRTRSIASVGMDRLDCMARPGRMGRVGRLAVMTLAAAVLAGCADFEIYKREGAQTVAASAPKISELLATVQALSDRAAALPGATDLTARLAQQKAALEALKARADGYPGALAAIAKKGTPGQALALLDQLRAALPAGVASATAAVGPLTAEVARLEEAAKAAAAQPPAAAFTRALPTGFALSGELTGIEARLLQFIEDAARPVDKTTWFDFDRLLFETGSARLDMDKSKGQLQNVAEILKAFPAVKVKVGGYTDNVGEAAANKKLSGERASNVAAAITALGVQADRLAPEGYGAEHPVCPANDTEACRAQNRRIALRVTAK